jgi:Flp pilus assembly protein TadG
MMIWLPVLLIVLFGAAELSRLWLAVAETTAAAREGARTGTQTPTGTGDVFNSGPAEATINAILTAANLSSGASVLVECPAPGGGGACVPGAEVRATVTVTFTTAAPTLLPGLASIPITEVVRMRYE